MNRATAPSRVALWRRNGQRQLFSFVFRSPRDPLLPQRIYALEHSGLGKLEILLVPIGHDEHGQRYQAILS